ncbi:MAG: hypothetical protein Q7U42_07185, partial [Parvibaculum sp.]|nr:hypothetical protein [Parvibaculum sp.]
MANSNQHDTVNGPLVSYVEANWSLAWKAVEEGRTGEGFILAIEGYLIDHRHLSSSENEEIRRDLE